jgi:hypothetical protein
MKLKAKNQRISKYCFIIQTNHSFRPKVIELNDKNINKPFFITKISF